MDSKHHGSSKSVFIVSIPEYHLFNAFCNTLLRMTLQYLLLLLSMNTDFQGLFPNWLLCYIHDNHKCKSQPKYTGKWYLIFFLIKFTIWNFIVKTKHSSLFNCIFSRLPAFHKLITAKRIGKALGWTEVKAFIHKEFLSITC